MLPICLPIILPPIVYYLVRDIYHQPSISHHLSFTIYYLLSVVHYLHLLFPRPGACRIRPSLSHAKMVTEPHSLLSPMIPLPKRSGRIMRSRKHSAGRESGRKKNWPSRPMMPVSKNPQWIRKNDGEANGKEQNQVEKEKERLIRPSHEQEVCF